MRLCACGCGQEVSKPQNKYILGHHVKFLAQRDDVRKKTSKRMKGSGNPKYKGHKDCLYSFWSERLIIDKYRENENGKVEVRCKYCNKWFTPTSVQLDNRVRQLDKDNDCCNFYCSDGCKDLCSDFYQVLWPKHYKPYDNRNHNGEVSADLRKMVFERDKWECQKCGCKEKLECHHIDPVSQEPMLANDIDSCITLCVDCHKEIHMNVEGCGYYDLKRKC